MEDPRTVVENVRLPVDTVRAGKGPPGAQPTAVSNAEVIKRLAAEATVRR